MTIRGVSARFVANALCIGDNPTQLLPARDIDAGITQAYHSKHVNSQGVKSFGSTQKNCWIVVNGPLPSY